MKELMNFCVFLSLRDADYIDNAKTKFKKFRSQVYAIYSDNNQKLWS